MVSDLLRGFVREGWAERLDFNTLERVREVGIGENLRRRIDDVIWRLRIVEEGQERWLYVYILLEFQSTVDRLMAVRPLTYIGLLYEDLHRSKAIGPDDLLPPVLAIVLYNGAEPWTAKTDLADLLDPRLPPQLRHWQPQMRYLLLEERRYQEADLTCLPNVAAALFSLKNARGAGPHPAGQRLPGRVAERGGARKFVWRKCVLLPTCGPGVEMPDVRERQELHDLRFPMHHPLLRPTLRHS